MKVAKEGGEVSRITRETIEKKLGQKVITNNNNLNYKYDNK